MQFAGVFGVASVATTGQKLYNWTFFTRMDILTASALGGSAWARDATALGWVARLDCRRATWAAAARSPAGPLT